MSDNIRLNRITVDDCIYGTQGDKGDRGPKGVSGRTIEESDIERQQLVYIYYVGESTPVTPTGGTYDFTVTDKSKALTDCPDGWEYPIYTKSVEDLNLYSSFYLFKSKGNRVTAGTWSVPVLENGIQGANASKKVTYYLRNSKSFWAEEGIGYIEKYGTSSLHTSPQGVDEDNLYEWKYYSYDQTNWTGPILVSEFGKNGIDGSDFEYIFALFSDSGETPSAPTGGSINTTDDWTGTSENSKWSDGTLIKWYDNPQELNETDGYCQWATHRKKNVSTGNWNDYVKPYIWSIYFSDKEPGLKLNILGVIDTNLKDYYDRDLITVNGFDTIYDGRTLESGDTFFIDGNAYIFKGTDNGNETDWVNAGSIKFSDGGLYYHQKYAKNIETLYYKDPDDEDKSLLERQKCFTGNYGESEIDAKYIGTYVDSNEKDSVDPLDYTWCYFVGSDGFGIEYIFTRTNNNTPPLTPKFSNVDNTQILNLCGTDENGVIWTDDPLGIRSDMQYEWFVKRTRTDGTFTDFIGDADGYARLYDSYNSSSDINGEDGIILYPAGYFDYSKTYERTDKTTPYVLYNDEYYYLYCNGKPGTTINNDPEASEASYDGIWEKIDKFDAIFTNALVADSSNIGSSTIFGNFIISQRGEDINGTEITYNGEEYYFNRESPFEESDDTDLTNNGTLGLFKPNWCVNFKTGQMWADCGRITTDSPNGLLVKDKDNDPVFYIDNLGCFQIKGSVSKNIYSIDEEEDYNKYFIMSSIEYDEEDTEGTDIMSIYLDVDSQVSIDEEDTYVKDLTNPSEVYKNIKERYYDIYYSYYTTVSGEQLKIVAPIGKFTNTDGYEEIKKTHENCSGKKIIPLSFDVKYSDSVININKVPDIELVNKFYWDNDLGDASNDTKDVVLPSSDKGIIFNILLPYLFVDYVSFEEETVNKYNNLITFFDDEDKRCIATYDDLYYSNEYANSSAKLNFYDKDNIEYGDVEDAFNDFNAGKTIYTNGYVGQLNRFLRTPTKTSTNVLHYITLEDALKLIGKTIIFRNNTDKNFIFSTTQETLEFVIYSGSTFNGAVRGRPTIYADTDVDKVYGKLFTEGESDSYIYDVETGADINNKGKTTNYYENFVYLRPNEEVMFKFSNESNFGEYFTKYINDVAYDYNPHHSNYLDSNHCFYWKKIYKRKINESNSIENFFE